MAHATNIVESSQPVAAGIARPRWRRWALRAIVLIPLALLLLQILHVTAGGNFHVVVPGKIYRGAQPDEATLESLTKRYGIRTIVNLRGTCHPQEWYLAEAKAAQNLGLSLEDVTCSAGRWPSHTEIRQLVAIFDHAEYPLFLHCRHGADRTGMAGAIALMLKGETSYAEARRQMSLRYGHAPIGRTTVLDRFFDLYEDWLKQASKEHDGTVFRHWLLEEYRGGQCQSVIEKVEPLKPSWRVNEPIGLRVRVHNSTTHAWQFKPTRTAGMHLGFHLWDDNGQSVANGRAGMFEKTVAPGERVDITLVVPPVAKEGTYRLFIDMIDEGHCWFYQTGSEPWEEDIDVRK